jgi:hypothetical protein
VTDVLRQMDLSPPTRPSILLFCGLLSLVAAGGWVAGRIAYRRPTATSRAWSPGLPAVDEAHETGPAALAGNWEDPFSETTFWLSDYKFPWMRAKTAHANPPPWVGRIPGVRSHLYFEGEWLADGERITFRAVDENPGREPGPSVVVKTYRYRFQDEFLVLEDGSGAAIRLVRVDDCASYMKAPTGPERAAIGFWSRVSPENSSVDWIELRADGTSRQLRYRTPEDGHWSLRGGVLYQMKGPKSCDAVHVEVKADSLTMGGEVFVRERRPD